ncbi:iron-siderophore ABC transporter substrate-binding protein [Conexibacter stalactiti]|uniref:Iron-siderophore ABC transporter substrate-binding protein n=1 Tax=Conexibacter stalactiti TaxID=1940611 RepID=A0ABU4HRV5_9ACTN|nr:iron-siderophore ABC transporter substrate-binding protein [Conexibacter stalactiti]MDW5596052.1 iron-siderophore ABC transporter substrate-binding protein [Conexibacter stalactiti]MEC5036694.1 iron-siderophore ABC transporter substrate-binding protein [Conexibacter stalactiti]
MSPISARRGLRLLALLLLLAVPLTLAACGSDDDDSATGTAAAATQTETAPADSAFPVTIEHNLGSTTIESQPRRVITLGLSDQDAVLALGVAPIAVTDWYGDYEYATWPWADAALAATAARPTVLARGEFTGNQSYDYEQIIGLRPDLILALYGGVSKKQYDTLSKIAPTVLQPRGTVDYGIAWQDATEVVGKALGREAEARRLVEDVDAQFAAAARDHPQFAGKTAVVAERFEPGSSFARSPTDPRSRFMTSLGFGLSDEIGRLSGDKDGATISDERIDLLDEDLLVWNLGFSPEIRRQLDRLAVYQALDVVRDGRVVYVTDPLASAALTWSTVLSIPYALERVLPQLDRAVRG